MTVHTCTMRVEKVCKVREEPAPCLITAQGATGCDGVWQCVAGRLSDKVLAPRSTVLSPPVLHARPSAPGMPLAPLAACEGCTGVCLQQHDGGDGDGAKYPAARERSAGVCLHQDR